MAAKFSLKYGEYEYLSAASVEKLAQAVNREAELWSKHYHAHQYVNSAGNAQRMSYPELRQNISSFDFSNGYIDLRGQNILTFPPYDSDQGRYLRTLKDSNQGLSHVYLQNWISEQRQRGQRLNLFDPNVQAMIGAALEWFRADTLQQISGRSAQSALISSSERLKAISEEHDAKAQEHEDTVSNARARVSQDLADMAAYRSKLQRISGKLLARTERRRANQEAAWSERWQTLHDSYLLKLRYESAVTLWSNKGDQHRTSSRWAFAAFCLIAAATGLFALLVSTQFGDDIASSFTKIRQLPGERPVEVFSYKGPVLVAGLLLASSILIWLMRFMGRIYLSERHLALAAEERKAFAETFHALVTDKTITAEHEAIVLSALFRPSQDGIIKDDEGGALDISAASILAKAMAGSK